MFHARSLVVASLSAFALVPACSSNAPAVPQAGISVEVTPGSNTSAQCPVALPDNVWNIGDANLAPVKDGDSQSGAPVHVTCTVRANNGGFDVVGDIELQGKGSFTVQGHMSGDTTQSQPGITATFVLAGGTGSWNESDCNVTFPQSDMGIAAGRIWAQIDCPTMKDPNRGTQCDGNAQFRLENCNQ